MKSTTTAADPWLYRHYPAVCFAIIFLAAPTIGAATVHDAPVLGFALFGHVYQPFAIVSWWGIDSDTGRGACAGIVLTYILGSAFTIAFMGLDFQNGRRFGALDILLFPLVIWLDLTTWSTGVKIELPKATPETPIRNAATKSVSDGTNWVAGFVLYVGCTLGGTYLAVSGVQGIAARARFSHPEEISLADFARRHPTAGWFAIQGARVDAAHGYRESLETRHDREIYAVRSIDGANGPIVAVVDSPIDDVPTTAGTVVKGVVAEDSDLEPMPNRRNDIGRLGGEVGPSVVTLLPKDEPAYLNSILRLLGGSALLYLFFLAPLSDKIFGKKRTVRA